LTKLYEHVLRGTVAEALEHYRAHPPRGEFTIVIAGDDVPVRGNAVAGNETDKPAMPTAMGGASNRRQRFDALVAQLGDRRLALAALAAETGLPRKALYAELVSGTGREPFASPSGRGRAQRG
jgi:16S rRNA (cytidine1402-2'-O)-methyltransferase